MRVRATTTQAAHGDGIISKDAQAELKRTAGVAAQGGHKAVLALVLEFDEAGRSARAAAALVPAVGSGSLDMVQMLLAMVGDSSTKTSALRGRFSIP